jgi:hypothetical protein
MRRLLLASAVAYVSSLAGCGGATPPPTRLGPEPPAKTIATFASSRCTNGVCKCRAQGDVAKEDPRPAPGLKRFELRVNRGPGKVWVTIDGAQQLYADPESGESCFYVDLSAGKHDLVVRGHSVELSGGVGASLQVSEYAAGPEKAPPWWYDTAYFQCGNPSPCDPESLESWKKEVDAYDNSLRDPCGSTKVRRAAWETGTMPDGLHPDDFAALLTLDVYPFAPKNAPGECDKARAK